MSDVYVGGLGWAVGERKHSVEESVAAGRTVTGAEALLDAGFRFHHVSEQGTTAYDLALASVQQSDPGAVDAIIYATCIPANANVAPAGDYASTRDVKHLMDFPASRLQVDLGLDDAFVVGLDQQACTGMLGSLRLARSLILTEPEVERVICVTADRFPEGAIYEQAYNLISDGAASCLVTAEPAAFRMLAARHVTNGALAVASDDETVGSYFGYTHRLIREVVAAAGLEVGDIARVVPQNTHRVAWEVLCSTLGVPIEKVAFPTLPDIGHVISGDNIANLSHVLEGGELRPGDPVLLVMAGYGMNWQAVILEKT